MAKRAAAKATEAGASGASSGSFIQIGQAYFLRTVTYHLVGRAVRQIGDFVELEDCAWVADSGRFMQAINNGTLNEVEPVGRAWVNLTAVTDVFPWVHGLPLKQK